MSAVHCRNARGQDSVCVLIEGNSVGESLRVLEKSKLATLEASFEEEGLRNSIAVVVQEMAEKARVSHAKA